VKSTSSRALAKLRVSAEADDSAGSDPTFPPRDARAGAIGGDRP
jgi:hypothetical protein